MDSLFEFLALDSDTSPVLGIACTGAINQDFELLRIVIFLAKKQQAGIAAA
jgi:hypothetical protein